MEVRTNWSGNDNSAAYQPYNGGSYTFNVGSNASLLIDASSITTGSVTAGLNHGNSIGWNAAAGLDVDGPGAITINGGVNVANGQTITMRSGSISYTGILSSGSSVGDINLYTSSNSVAVGLGGTSLTNTAPYQLTNSELQNISTGGLYIEGGATTAFSNIDLSPNGLTYVEVRTNWSGGCNCSPYQTYNGESYSFNVGTTAGLLIDAYSILTGSIIAGVNRGNTLGINSAANLNGYGLGGVTINGSVTVNNGQDITIRGGSIYYPGILYTGSSTGSVHLETSSGSTDVGLGGTAGNNTATFALTLSELQSINTGNLYIEGGATTGFGNIDLSAQNLNYVEVRTNWDGNCNCAVNQPYNAGSYTLNVGSNAALLIDAGSITTGNITAGVNRGDSDGLNSAAALYAYGTGAVTINGSVTVGNGQNITIHGGGINYTGTLNTGASAGSVDLWTTSNSIDVGLGGTAVSNTGTFALTLSELQSITTGNLYIEGGAATVFGNIDLSAQNLNYVEVRTNWNGNSNNAGYQPYNGSSYTLNVESSAGLLIDASSITTGSVTSGLNRGNDIGVYSAADLNANGDGAVTINGSVTTGSGQIITIRAASISYSGSLDTDFGNGSVYLETTSNSIDVGIGGDNVSNTATYKLTLAELQAINTGSLYIEGGQTTLFGDVDLSANGLSYMEIRTNWAAPATALITSHTMAAHTILMLAPMPQF